MLKKVIILEHIKQGAYGKVWWATMYTDGQQVSGYCEWFYTKKEAIAQAQLWRKVKGLDYHILEDLT